MTTTPTSKAPTPAQPAAKSPASQKKIILIASAVGVLLVAIVCGWLIWKLNNGALPRLNENTVILTKFVGTSRFDKLPFDQQRQYLKVMGEREEELDKAFKDGLLNESEYRAGLDAEYLGKHLSRTEKYFSTPPGQERTKMLDKLLDKKDKKDWLDNAKDDEIKRDGEAEKIRMEAWPADVKEQWKQFHKALKDQKKAREKAAARKPAPTSKPGQK